MKRFEKFAEDMDKVAALKAKQKATVDKFKSTSKPTPVQKPERKERKILVVVGTLMVLAN